MQDLIELEKYPVVYALQSLLEDKSTGKNIIFATDMYSSYGYGELNTVTTEALKGLETCDIQPRVFKAQSEQSIRTKKKAEVFTPVRICNMMINHCDSDWFGYDGVFNKTDDEGNILSFSEKVLFENGKTWQQYVDSRRLEITCGEAPYLVSRYDTTTGKIIPVKERIGILDRKLRVVSENAADEAEWLKWAKRAVQSVYGYEWQGDNLIIARINLLVTYCDWLSERWHREATKPEIKSIANIIAWNIWQMDGLDDCVPLGTPEDKFSQISFFSEGRDEPPNIQCKIYDWRADRSKSFSQIKVKNERGVNMKFDYVIGNPPYQETALGDKLADNSIYNYFMDSSYQVADKVELIHPARFLFNNGNTPEAWNQKMLNDPHLKVLMYEALPQNIFPGVGFKGGIAITYRDVTKNFGSIVHFTPFSELNSALKKVLNISDKFIDAVIYNQNKFNLDELYRDYPHLKKVISGNGKEKRLTSGCMHYECFHDEKSSNDDISIIGLYNGKRKYRYINKKYLETPHKNLEKYKVILPANNGSGAIGEVISTPLIGSPLIGYTQTFISIGAFDSGAEAENAMKYIKSKFARAMLGVLKVTQNGKKNVWKYVPLQDFSENSDIDWSRSISDIDKQLYDKYGLSSDEISFIESHVKEMS